MPRKGDSPSTAQLIEGGWLRRITSGTAAVYLDAAGPATPQTTTRSLRVGGDLLERWALKSGTRPYHDPRHVARRTGIPLGTVEVILARLSSQDWAESEWYEGTRLYRLTKAGRAGIAASLDQSPPAPAATSTRRP